MSLRLTYFYTRHRNYPLAHMQTDGHFDLMKGLVEHGIVSKVRVIRDNYAVPSKRDINCTAFESWSVNSIEEVLLDPGEIVWIRGGFKAWLPWIEKHTRDHWFMFYGANTGHERWSHWDIVLEDRTDEGLPVIATGERLVWPYIKPTSSAFHMTMEAKRDEWDVCVGASHIFDRKGQFRALELSDEFERLTRRKLRIIIPGRFYGREAKTEIMRQRLLAREYPNITLTGEIPRRELVSVFNRSKFFYATTCGGQGDRSVLESAACGCRMLFALAKNHAPHFYRDARFAFVQPHQDDVRSVAEYLAKADFGRPKRKEVAAHFHKLGNMDRVVSRLDPLFNFMSMFKKDRSLLAELLGEI